MLNPLTKKGEWSVKVFGLNREELRKARAKAEREAGNMLRMMLQFEDEGKLDQKESLARAETDARSYVIPLSPYSAARWAALDRFIARERGLLG